MAKLADPMRISTTRAASTLRWGVRIRQALGLAILSVGGPLDGAAPALDALCFVDAAF